jgi:uncharacterized membrane protein YcjF (UPF0283 family)
VPPCLHDDAIKAPIAGDIPEMCRRHVGHQSVAIIAATPSPALDALALGWCGVRLIRQVATLHGERPGLMGTLALLRRTALSAATIAATEVAVNLGITDNAKARACVRSIAGWKPLPPMPEKQRVVSLRQPDRPA